MDLVAVSRTCLNVSTAYSNIEGDTSNSDSQSEDEIEIEIITDI